MYGCGGFTSSVGHSQNFLPLGSTITISLFGKISPIKSSWIGKKSRSSYLLINIVMLCSSDINWYFCSKKAGTRLFWQCKQNMWWYFYTFVIMLFYQLLHKAPVQSQLLLEDCSYIPLLLPQGVKWRNSNRVWISGLHSENAIVF